MQSIAATGIPWLVPIPRLGCMSDFKNWGQKGMDSAGIAGVQDSVCISFVKIVFAICHFQIDRLA